MDIAHALKCWTTGMPVLFTGGVPACRAGDERLAGRLIEAPVRIGVSSDLFGEDEPLPTRYTADGENLSPPLTWHGVPHDAASLVLIAEDPDAPTPKPFVHWLAYNIDPAAKGFPEGRPLNERVNHPVQFLQGKNSQLKVGYTGAAPPRGDTPHHYHFQLFALDRVLDLKPGAGRSALLRAMEGHVIAKGDLVGTYQR